MVEGDRGDVVVEDVGLDDAVQKRATDKSEFAVDSSSRATSVSPSLSVIVRKSRVGVLEEGDGDCFLSFRCYSDQGIMC